MDTIGLYLRAFTAAMVLVIVTVSDTMAWASAVILVPSELAKWHVIYMQKNCTRTQPVDCRSQYRNFVD